jgi:serine/threonine protein kinase/Tol biopolymer transport system component
MTLGRGTLLNNRYRIVDILGQGGMASIYRAVDENLNLDVAVKENLFTTEEFARQFRLEAVILAGLRHSNLPRVTDHFVIPDQGQYLVMDYIEGEDLRQRMDRMGVLPDEEVIVVGVAITEALQYLHSSTPPIYHRDIKPGNVKVNPQGHVYLVDFGLAKVENEGQLTTTGARAMTPGYSPPEQYGAARTDQRTDIYSLGATLYSALTDSLPEDGLARAMGQVDLTPLRYRNPNVSRRLASVIEKALEVHPEDRYQDAEQFQQELLNCRSISRRKTPLYLTLPPPPLEEESPIPPENDAADQEVPLAANSQSALLPLPVSASVVDPVSKPRRRQQQRWRSSCLAVVLVGLLVLLGGAAIFLNVPPFDGFLPPPTTQTMALPLAGAASQEAIQASPMSTDRFEMIATMQGDFQVEPLATSIPGTPQVLDLPTHTPAASQMVDTGPAQIAFASNRDGLPQIYLVNTDGSGLRQITDMPDGACQPDFSPDGMQIVFISPCEKYQESYPLASMFMLSIGGENLTPLSNVPGGDYDPAWSPDGKYIAFTSLRSGGQPKIYLLNLENQTATLLADEGNKNIQPAWSPDGKEIAFVTNRRGPQQVWFMNADGSDQRLFSRSSDLVNSSPAWSPDGKVILFTQLQPNSVPRLMAAAQEEDEFSEFPIIQSPNPMRDARYSPDSAWLAFESWQWAQSGGHDIYIMSSSGVNLQQVTNDPSFDFQPVWRPASPSP